MFVKLINCTRKLCTLAYKKSIFPRDFDKFAKATFKSNEFLRAGDLKSLAESNKANTNGNPSNNEKIVAGSYGLTCLRVGVEEKD